MMKQMSKLLAVLLVLATLCSCKSSGKWVNQKVPVSDAMIGSVKQIFTAVPKGTFLTADAASSSDIATVMDLALLSPDVKKAVDLTSDLHKINNTAICALSSDGTKMLVKFSEKPMSSPGINFTRDYAFILNQSGDVLFSAKLKSFFYSEDLNTVVYTDTKSGVNYLIDVVNKKKSVIFKDATVSGIEGGYVYGTLKSSNPNDTVTDSSGNLKYNHTLLFYNLKTQKSEQVKSIYQVKSIINNHALLYDQTAELLAGHELENGYSDLDLDTKDVKQIDNKTAGTSFARLSANGSYSVEVVNNADDSGVIVKNVSTNQTVVYPLNEEGIVMTTNFRWMEKK